MAEQIAPTRSNLLQRRDQLQLANRGADLLKRKRDALITEFFDLVQSSLEARRSLSGTSQEAYFSLFLANAWDGPEAVESLSLASQSGLDVDIKMENLFGVKVPQVQPPSFSDDLPFSPINAGARTLDAAREFRKLTEALIKVAATETRLRRIGEEIKKTNRRVNALEQLVIPGINQQIKDIRSVLDQRALEEVTVLKRIKAKLEAREKEENEQAKEDKSISEPYPDNETSMADTVEEIEKVGVAPAEEQSDVDEREGQKETVSAAASSEAQSSAAAKDSARTASAGTSPASSASETHNKVADTKAGSATMMDGSTKADKAPVVDAPDKNATKDSSSNPPQQAKEPASAKGASTETASTGSDGVLLGAEADKYIANLETYTSDVNGNVVRAILASFGDAVNDRDAMTVACAQPKELRYIKTNLLRGRLDLQASDEVLDKAVQDVCEQMGRSNRNKSSVTFYYLLSEKFAKLPVWLA